MDLTDTLSSGGEEAFAAVEVLFSIGYMALLSAQLLVVPFDEFWLSLRNRFDFVVTVLLFATAIVWVWPTVHVSRDTLHRLTILRLLRLVSKLELLPRSFRRADIPRTGRGGAAAARWIFRGDKSRRRRGCDVDIPWRVAAASRLRHGNSV